MTIGIFDSGFGGLTTLRELVQILPEYDYLYFGDSARAPYGNKSIEQVTEYTTQGVEFLIKKGASMILIACNTASADALRFLQKKYEGKTTILGVLIPAVEQALEVSRYGNIGIVGTRNTIESKNYEKEIEKRYPLHYKPTEKKASKVPRIYTQACPLLVPLIEEGWSNKPETRMILKKYLLHLKSCHIDTLILGCTHYPLIEKDFQRKMGKNCTIIDSGKAQAQKLQDYLTRHPDKESLLSKSKKREFFTTDSEDRFYSHSKDFIQISRKNIQRVSL